MISFSDRQMRIIRELAFKGGWPNEYEIKQMANRELTPEEVADLNRKLMTDE